MTIAKWFWINVILKVLDVSLTLYIIESSSINAEGNPFIRYSIELYGIYPTMILIILGHTSLLYLLYNRNRESLLKIAALLMLIVAINNVFVVVLWAKKSLYRIIVNKY